jgi:subfamily B ATP-binding cassette protein MsbA
MRGDSLYFRLLGFLRPHLDTFVPAIVFMILMAIFSGLTVALMQPFTTIVIQGKELPEVSASSPDKDDLPLGATVREWGLKVQDSWYDLLRGRDRLDALTRFCIVLFVVTVLKNLTRYAQSVLMVTVEERVIRDIRNAVFERYLALPMAYFSEMRSGHLISRIVNDVNLARGAIAGGLAKGLRQVFLACGYVTVAVLASWRLFLMTIVIAPVCFWIIHRLGLLIRRHGRRSQEQMGELTTILDETIVGARIVKAFGLEPDRRRRFVSANDRYRRTMTRLSRVGSLAPPLTETLGMIAGIVMIAYAGRAIIMDNGMDPGRFLMFIGALFGVMQPVRILSNVNVEIQTGLAAATRIFEMLDTPDRTIEKANAVAPPRRCEDVVFHDVSFEYVPGTPVLRGVHITAPAGSVIGLVGPSGAGKSTLLDLIPRFYDPTGGSITIGGIDIRDFRLVSLRDRIGYVTQDTVLFHDSIRANIEMGRPGASFDDVVAAARAANADAFIRALPGGYDTVIGDRGLKLSGGQRQRVAIARALLKDPPILLFDEATSALDTEAESLIQEAIERLLRDRTTFVIAHRLSTVQRADQILVIEDGRIIERGTHESLLSSAGRYKHLHDLQLAAGDRSPR